MTHTSTPTTPEPPPNWLTCDGQLLKKLVRAGLFWLELHQQEVNALNVFPVPDGDTGTNMLLTMRSAWRRIENNAETHVGNVAHELAQGALMGARGNSGVILSQIWRGTARALKGKATLNAEDIGQAFQEACETAYGGVMKPVEGTILTVIREGAEEAVDAAEKSDDTRFVLRRTLTRCRQALARTPDLLPILKQAGVVDSGGQGLVYILEGMYKYALGELDDIESTDFEQRVAAEHDVPAQARAAPEDGVLANHYDVQFMLLGRNLNVTEVRETIDAMGDSTVVVGDETTIKVHVHVEDPGRPISYAIGLGEIMDVVVENMQMQMDEIIQPKPAGEANNHNLSTTAQALAPTVTVEPGQIGVVAVAPGEGLANVLRDLGVAAVVEGGQTNNPSIEEILGAIQALPTDRVIVLPNNKNIILAAEAARDLSDNQVVVLPTRTVPQGISAMLSLHPDGELEAVAAAMQASAAEVATAEITVATRSVEIDGVQVAEGDVIGLVDGRLCAAGTDIPSVLEESLAAIDEMEEREIMTLFYGLDVSAGDAAEIAARIEALYPHLEIEIQPGGQPYYFYILGVE